jgi:predicted lysophospholipase L1 biosynthesis ABC-type transport system permease subunit
VKVNYVTPGWFDTYGMTRRAGRLIDARDGATGPPVVVANEAFARRFFAAGQPVGAHVARERLFPGDVPTPRTVVGVVGDAFDDQSLRFGTLPTLYWPLAQCECPAGIFPATIAISVRSASGSPVQLARSVAAALTAVDRNLAFSFRPLADQVDAVRHQERLVAWLSGFFGGLALLLSAIGLYGVTSYDVARRRSEIGIRVALGARRRAVVGLTLRQAALTTIVGLAVGLAAATAVTRYFETLLFGVTPLDPVTFIAAPALLAVVALIASYLPARHATGIDPVTALRCE